MPTAELCAILIVLTVCAIILAPSKPIDEDAENDRLLDEWEAEQRAQQWEQIPITDNTPDFSDEQCAKIWARIESELTQESGSIDLRKN